MTTDIRQLPKFIGEPIKRREDPKLVSGLGAYVDDIKLPGMLHLAVVRSSRANARLQRVGTQAAKNAPGVALVMTGAEARAWGGEVPVGTPGPTVKRRYPLNDDVVRFVGDPIAAVVASDRYVARDAADLVDVDYEDLPVTIDARKALEPGAPLVYP